MSVKLNGAIERSFDYERSRDGNVHKFEGPDVWGNGRSYGRYLWSTQHFYGEAAKIRARETLVDEKNSLCVVWQFFASGKEQYTVFGVLDWTPGDNVLEARYVE